jgi:hypothetical protein
VKRFFVDIVWAKLEWPVALILVHVGVSLLALIGLALIKVLLRFIGIEEDIVPGSKTTVGNWILYLEIITSSVIIIAGALEALAVLVLDITLECVKRGRETGRAWRS